MSRFMKILAIISFFVLNRSLYSSNQVLEELLKKIDQRLIFSEEEMQQWFSSKNENKQRELLEKGVSWVARRCYEPDGWQLPSSRYVQAVKWLLDKGALLDQGEDEPKDSTHYRSTISVLLHTRLLHNHEAFKSVFVDKNITIPLSVLNRTHFDGTHHLTWSNFMDPIYFNSNPQEMLEASCASFRYLLEKGFDIRSPYPPYKRGIYNAVLSTFFVKNKRTDEVSRIRQKNMRTIKEIIQDFLIYQKQGNLEKLFHDTRLADVIILNN